MDDLEEKAREVVRKLDDEHFLDYQDQERFVRALVLFAEEALKRKEAEHGETCSCDECMGFPPGHFTPKKPAKKGRR